MVGLFIFGAVVTAIVVAACWIVSKGIRDEKSHREAVEADQGEQLREGLDHDVTTRGDARTVRTGRR